MIMRIGRNLADPLRCGLRSVRHHPDPADWATRQTEGLLIRGVRGSVAADADLILQRACHQPLLASDAPRGCEHDEVGQHVPTHVFRALSQSVAKPLQLRPALFVRFARDLVI